MWLFYDNYAKFYHSSIPDSSKTSVALCSFQRPVFLSNAKSCYLWIQICMRINCFLSCIGTCQHNKNQAWYCETACVCFVCVFVVISSLRRLSKYICIALSFCKCIDLIRDHRHNEILCDLSMHWYFHFVWYSLDIVITINSSFTVDHACIDIHRVISSLIISVPHRRVSARKPWIQGVSNGVTSCLH